MKKIFIDELKNGMAVSDFFAVSNCEKRLTKANKSFITAKVSDCTGTVSAIAWDNAEALEKILVQGTIVKINAIAESYDGNVQLKILDAIELKANDKIDIADFKKASQFNLDKLFDELTNFINSIQNEKLKTLLNYFFDNAEFSEKFKVFPAAKSMHHAYAGGLIEHTLSIARSADLLCQNYTDINRDLLICGVILHDFAKIFEFNNDLVVEYSVQGSLIGHIVMGAELVGRAADTIPEFPPELKWQVQHLLLSHHGEPEFGAAVVPATLEAVVLSALDRLDTHIFQITNAIKNEQEKPGEFTSKIYGIDRKFYKSELSESKEININEALDTVKTAKKSNANKNNQTTDEDLFK